MMMRIGNTSSSTMPKTDVSDGPRNGVCHRIRDRPGGRWFSKVRQSTAGNPWTRGGASVSALSTQMGSTHSSEGRMGDVMPVRRDRWASAPTPLTSSARELSRIGT